MNSSGILSWVNIWLQNGCWWLTQRALLWSSVCWAFRPVNCCVTSVMGHLKPSSAFWLKGWLLWARGHHECGRRPICFSALLLKCFVSFQVLSVTLPGFSLALLNTAIMFLRSWFHRDCSECSLLTRGLRNITGTCICWRSPWQGPEIVSGPLADNTHGEC